MPDSRCVWVNRWRWQVRWKLTQSSQMNQRPSEDGFGHRWPMTWSFGSKYPNVKPALTVPNTETPDTICIHILYVYVYTHTHVYTYVYIHIYIHIRHVCMYVRMYVCMYVCTYMYMCIHMKNKCKCICLLICA